MIRRVKLENFQSHESTDFKLGDGLNVIVGQSDSGKTAILRAIRWVLTNRPLGDAFRSSWGGDTVVEISTGGKRIRRTKTKSENSYEVRSKGPGEPFKATGKDVPEEVLKALNLDPSLNVQDQHDPPFLLFQSPAEISRTLNRVASLEVIDRSTKKIASMIRGKKTLLAGQKEELQKVEHQIETAFQNLDKLQILLSGSKSLVATIEEFESDLRDLTGAINRIEEAQKKADEIFIPKWADDLDSFLEDARNLFEEERVLREFREKVDSVSRHSKKLDEIKIKDDLLKEVEEAEQEADKTRRALIAVKRLNESVSLIEDVEKRLGEISKEMNALNEELKEIFPSICPFYQGKKGQSPELCPFIGGGLA